ncbi:hypothetical protein AB1Y20_023270 [Prymnesium parvum]|uniref:Uncharacterized protein n=1 Tax=Prymnesium parvum TaxID=97485 RepID=A0AB34JEY8_PRYPA
MLKSVVSLFDAPQHAVLPPAKETRELRKEHFAVDISQLRFPATLDFSHAHFKLRDLSFLRAAREAAPRDVNVAGNELSSLEVLNRFHQLRSIVACANALVVGGGLVLRLPQLTDLDLSSNKLSAIPPLSELPRLQVLRLQRNQIQRNWGELRYVAKTLRDLDVSNNRFNWAQSTGEFDEAMKVLSALKGLKELRLGGNPVSETPGLRYLVITYTSRLQRFDGVAVSEHERRGKLRGTPLVAPMATMVVAEMETEMEGGRVNSSSSDEEEAEDVGDVEYTDPHQLASMMRAAVYAEARGGKPPEAKAERAGKPSAAPERGGASLQPSVPHERGGASLKPSALPERGGAPKPPPPPAKGLGGAVRAGQSKPSVGVPPRARLGMGGFGALEDEEEDEEDDDVGTTEWAHRLANDIGSSAGAPSKPPPPPPPPQNEISLADFDDSARAKAIARIRAENERLWEENERMAALTLSSAMAPAAERPKRRGDEEAEREVMPRVAEAAGARGAGGAATGEPMAIPDDLLAFEEEEPAPPVAHAAAERRAACGEGSAPTLGTAAMEHEAWYRKRAAAPPRARPEVAAWPSDAADAYPHGEPQPSRVEALPPAERSIVQEQARVHRLRSSDAPSTPPPPFPSALLVPFPSPPRSSPSPPVPSPSRLHTPVSIPLLFARGPLQLPQHSHSTPSPRCPASSPASSAVVRGRQLSMLEQWKASSSTASAAARPPSPEPPSSAMDDDAHAPHSAQLRHLQQLQDEMKAMQRQMQRAAPRRPNTMAELLQPTVPPAAAAPPPRLCGGASRRPDSPTSDSSSLASGTPRGVHATPLAEGAIDAQAEERIVAAAAAAAGAVVASESIKWRARTERLEAERRQQAVKQAELHEALAAAQLQLAEAEAEASEARRHAGLDGNDVVEAQRAELVRLKDDLQSEREAVRAEEEAVAAARREVAAVERGEREAEEALRQVEARLEAHAAREEGARAEEYRRALRAQIAEAEMELARRRAAEAEALLPSHERPSWMARGGGDVEAQLRQRKEEMRAQLADEDSARCAWREVAWRAAWGVWLLAGRVKVGERVPEDGRNIAGVAEEVASRTVLWARKEIEAEAEADEEGASDWAAAMERDAFETVAMEFSLEVDRETMALDASAAQWQLATSVLHHWKDMATREAQRLLRLNEIAAAHETEWKRQLQQHESAERVQAHMALAAAGSSHATAEDVQKLRAQVAEVSKQISRAEAGIAQLQRERSDLEAEVKDQKKRVARKKDRMYRLNAVM